MNKILLLASKPNASLALLQDELKKRSNISFQANLFSDLEFQFTSHQTVGAGFTPANCEIYAGQKVILDFDLVYIINVGPYKEMFNVLMSYLVQRQIKFIDPILANGNHYEIYKFSQIGKLIAAGLPCPRTFVGFNLDSVIKFFNVREPFKLVAKNSMLDRGEGVFLVTNLNQLDESLKKGRLIQEFIPEKLDLRVLTISGKAIGCMRRIPTEGEFRANLGQGGRGEIYPLSPELENLALKAARAMNLDFAGVDILIDRNDRKYILEVNRSPQYQGFMQVTGVNVAAKIADFLESKLRS